MSWAQHHTESERLAVAAHDASRAADSALAERLYIASGKAEMAAFDALSPDKERTRGITAVSAVSLFYKGRDLKSAQGFACQCLAEGKLPDFAVVQIQNLPQTVWSEQALMAAGLKFARQDVFVSVRGGEIVPGGAPLDLILRKVEEIRALFYRTVEWLMNKPLRTRGGPTLDIQELFRPWLFHAPAGSYQFAVRLESPKQLELGLVPSIPPVEEVTEKFLEVVSAAADSESELEARVADVGYRNAFLKLARNLAPTGKSFTELEIRSEIKPAIGSIKFVPESRRVINDTIKKLTPNSPSPPEGVPVRLEGILRAVHLDQDWLEVTIVDDGEKHVKVLKAGDAIDDVVGPMINRRVLVDVVQAAGGKNVFRDIQAAE